MLRKTLNSEYEKRRGGKEVTVSLEVKRLIFVRERAGEESPFRVVTGWWLVGCVPEARSESKIVVALYNGRQMYVFAIIS